jgi:hypothetical protein
VVVPWQAHQRRPRFLLGCSGPLWSWLYDEGKGVVACAKTQVHEGTFDDHARVRICETVRGKYAICRANGIGIAGALALR